MALPEDYVGRSFGPFEILRTLGHGAEAEVYLCVNNLTRRRYVLRLSVHDDEMWDGAPKIPPTNKSLEVANAVGSWHAKQTYEPLVDANQKKVNDLEWTFNVPVIYGVLDNRYLIPVSDPYRLKSSLDLVNLLELAPSDDLDFFELWEDIALTSLHQLSELAEGTLDRESWTKQWGCLIHGPIMKQALRRYMLNGGLSKKTQSTILSLIPDSYEDYPQLADNLVLRLIGAVTRGRCSLDAAKRTLRSRYFRENLSYRELGQMLAAYEILSAQAFPAENSLTVLQYVLYALSEPIHDYKQQPMEFELCEAQAAFDGFDLFLQEFAGKNMPLPGLQKSEEP